MMRNKSRRQCLAAAALTSAIVGFAAEAHAQLLLYEPFNYTVGENLGGTDPDGPGPAAGNPQAGQTGTYAGGGAYKWRAHGTVSNYQSPNDAVISSGSLSYTGLATSQGNSVSYGSDQPNSSLYVDAIPLPSPITSGSLYASFIIRIKSDVSGTELRHSPAAFLAETTSDANAGGALASQSGSLVAEPGVFWMRKDPTVLNVTNFGPGKTNNDGIGQAALGPSSGWQNSDTVNFTESNQFGAVGGQVAPIFADPNTYQTYFVVMKYEFDAASSSAGEFDPPGSTPGSNGQTATVSLWMNPGTGTLGSATGEADASQNPTGNLGSYFAALDAYGTSTPDSTTINSFALFGHRQNRTATMAVDFDELRIGTTWASVTPAAAAGQPGDFNGDGVVDAADYVALRKTGGNYSDFFENFGEGSPGGSGGQVPEPSSAILILITTLFMHRVTRR
jgi:hypothetical protein